MPAKHTKMVKSACEKFTAEHTETWMVLNGDSELILFIS